MTKADVLDPRLLQIAHKLKQLRLQAGYTSYEVFAYEHDLPRVGYGRHEKGSNLTMGSLLRLLDIHHLSLAEFFADLPPILPTSAKVPS